MSLEPLTPEEWHVFWPVSAAEEHEDAQRFARRAARSAMRAELADWADIAAHQWTRCGDWMGYAHEAYDRAEHTRAVLRSLDR